MVKKRTAILGLLAAASTAIFPALALKALAYTGSISGTTFASLSSPVFTVTDDWISFAPNGVECGEDDGGGTYDIQAGYFLPYSMGGTGCIVSNGGSSLGDFHIIFLDKAGQGWNDCITTPYNDVNDYNLCLAAFASSSFADFNDVLMTYDPGFVPPAPPSSANVIAIVPGLGLAMSTSVGDQLGDQGTLKLIGIVAGVYLVFYVMKQLISMVPKKSE